MMKVKKNKKLLAILLTTVMSLAALTGCGESPVESETGSESQVSATAEAPAATESASQEEITINFWHHYSAQSAENETLMNVLIPEFEKEIIRSYNTSKKSFVEVPEDDRDSLQLFAFICNLSFDIYVKKQIVEKLLDNFPDLLHSEKKNSNKKDSNKDTKKKK